MIVHIRRGQWRKAVALTDPIQRRGGRSAALAASLAAVLVAAACQSDSSPPVPSETPAQVLKGGTVVRGSFADAKILSPFLSTDTASSVVWGLMFEGLTSADPETGASRSELARSWEISADGLTYTFKLRDDVTWHDGQPFTADDVKFTYETIMDPKTKTVRKSLFDRIKGAKAKAEGKASAIEGIQVLDKHTVRIELAEPFCPFMISTTGMGIVPKHLLENSPDINTDKFNTESPIGTGPFRFKEWVRDDHITLTANEHYWKGQPNLDTVVFKVVADANVVAAQLKSGEIHVGSIEPQFLAEMEATPGVTVHKYDSPGYNYLGYNLARPLFADRRVRQAFTHAVDRQKILERVLFNQGDLNDVHTPKKSWAFNPDIPQFPYDPGKAKQLLAEAGYHAGPDGMLRDTDGKAVRVTLHTNSGSKAREAFATIAKEQLKAIGVEVDVQLEDFNAHLDRLNKTRDFDLIVSGWSLGRDPDARSIWHSEENKKEGGFNSVAYNNPEVDRLLEQGRTVPGCEPAKRQEIYGKFQRILAEDQPYNFGFSIKSLLVVNAKLKNVKPSSWAGPFWNIHEWHSATGK